MSGPPRRMAHPALAGAAGGCVGPRRVIRVPLGGALPRAARVAAVLLLWRLAALVAPSALADPPGRVGRLSAVEGEARVLTGEGEALPAELNLPITSGFVLQTGYGARAEVRIGSIAVRLDGAGTLRFIRVDDAVVAIALDRGALALRLRARDTAVETVVQTPDGQVSFGDAGRYRIDVDASPARTSVYAESGFARVAASDVAIDVRAGRAVEIESGAFRFVRPVVDDFDAWSLARDQYDGAVGQGYVSPEMTGYEDLAAYGGWRTTVAYGLVWVPHAVPASWSPYRHGRWQWIAPWGWTWIDAAPWGFAPFHYGRWCWVDGVWGWAPGAWVARPVYAPALVGWIGRAGWSVQHAGTAIAGWVPLAPGEAFVPWYRASAGHVRSVNVVQGNAIVVHRGLPPPTPPAGMGNGAPGILQAQPLASGAYANARAPYGLTAAPAAVVAHGQRIVGDSLGAAVGTQLVTAPPLAPISPIPTGSRWAGTHTPGAIPSLPASVPSSGTSTLSALPQIPAQAPPRGEVYRPDASALPATPRFGSTPFGFAGSTPRVAPSVPLPIAPARPVHAPSTAPMASAAAMPPISAYPPPATLPAMRPYSPPAWPDASYSGGVAFGATPRAAPIASGVAPVPHPGVAGGFAPSAPFRAPAGAVRAAHR